MRSTVLSVSFLAASALALPQAQPSSVAAAATPAGSSASATASGSAASASPSASASASANMTTGGPGQPVPYQQGPYGLQNANCSDYNLTIPINSTNFQYQNVDEQYSNQSYVTGTFLDLTADMKGWAAQHLTNQTYQLNQTYYIAATYCSPKTGARENASLPVLTHGVSFDGSYWDFSYGDEYSVQKQLASWGYPSLRYDRLGCGNSTVPNNGFQDVQTQTEVSIYKQILNLVRNSTEIGGRSWNRTVGVGHSFGSIINQAVTVTNPELLDGVVLTGYSAYQGAVQTFTAAATFTIANSTGRSKFASYPPEWLVTGSATALMFDFFRPPAGPDGNFALEAFNHSREAEGPVTLGTLTSMSTVGGTASNFTKPVFVVTGAEDLPFCGGNCSSISPSLADGVKQQYPAASTYDTFSPNNTGHGIVAHYSGPLAAQRIAQFLIDTGL